jgi:hypothetical protein
VGLPARWLNRVVLLALTHASGGCAIPIIGAPSRDETASQTSERNTRSRRAGLRLGTPRAAATLDPEACYAELSHAHVAFERVAGPRARGVEMPARLLGPIGGVVVEPSDGRELHALLDCRLALALLSWAPALRKAGVTAIDHYSIYRPGARVRRSGSVSGHARGMAIDAARFHLQNGAVLDVLTDWEERDRGSAPCPRRPEEAWQSRLLRGVVCDAIDHNLFQVVITPHHDHDHDNHVHLELRPQASYSYVR